MAVKKTATKPAAKATPTTEKEPVVWDGTDDTDNADVDFDPALFDAWDEEAEAAALAAAAAAADVKYIILEGRIFVGRFPNGETVQAPLTFSVADLDEITATYDNPVDQVKGLLAKVGNADGAVKLEQQNLTSTVIYAEKFFDVFAKVAQVAMGKPTA